MPVSPRLRHAPRLVIHRAPIVVVSHRRSVRNFFDSPIRRIALASSLYLPNQTCSSVHLVARVRGGRRPGDDPGVNHGPYARPLSLPYFAKMLSTRSPSGVIHTFVSASRKVSHCSASRSINFSAESGHVIRSSSSGPAPILLTTHSSSGATVLHTSRTNATYASNASGSPGVRMAINASVISSSRAVATRSPRAPRLFEATQSRLRRCASSFDAASPSVWPIASNTIDFVSIPHFPLPPLRLRKANPMPHRPFGNAHQRPAPQPRSQTPRRIATAHRTTRSPRRVSGRRRPGCLPPASCNRQGWRRDRGRCGQTAL
jgi:hypothetical protein